MTITLLRLLVHIVYLLIVFLYYPVQFHEGVLYQRTVGIEEVVTVTRPGCSLLKVVT